MTTVRLMLHIIALALTLLAVSRADSEISEDAAASDAGAVPAVRFEQIADGVWMHTSFKDLPPWGPFPTNGLVIEVTAGEAVLVDTAWNDDQTEAILAWAESVLGLSVRAAILTHAHDDKMGGVGVLRRSGVETFAHALSNELAPMRGLVSAEHDVAFDVSGMARISGELSRQLEIYYPGPGHTVDNLVVYIPKARVLFGGCLIRPGRSVSLGNTADAVVGNWAAATENVMRRFPETAIVVPSHGPQGGPELLAHTIDMAAAAAAKE